MLLCGSFKEETKKKKKNNDLFFKIYGSSSREFIREFKVRVEEFKFKVHDR